MQRDTEEREAQFRCSILVSSTDASASTGDDTSTYSLEGQKKILGFFFRGSLGSCNAEKVQLTLQLRTRRRKKEREGER